MTAPLLSLAMMVKNEEAFLEDALRSASSFCDELVVVDTGSTDRTVEIARDLGARVSHFAWCDDFSAARNETLRQARGRYVAVLDADERFRGHRPADVRRLLGVGPAYPFEGVSLPVINVTLEGDVISTFRSVRIFGNAPDRLAYHGRVHNQLRAVAEDGPKILATLYDPLEVVHLGYDARIYRQRRKAERSLPLIEASMRDAPGDLRWRYYLGREFALLGRVDEAVSQFLIGLRLGATARRNGGSADFLAEMTAGLLDAARQTGTHVDEALEAAHAHLRDDSAEPGVWFALARLLRREALPEDALRCLDSAETALGLSAERFTYSTLRQAPWRITEERGHALVALQRLPEAAEAFALVVQAKPEDDGGWPELLNLAAGLAIDLGLRERLPGLLTGLARREDTRFDMIYVALEHSGGDRAGGRRTLETLSAASSRFAEDPRTAEWRARLA